jgi:putative tricarboxylic transport membrane protein
MGAANVIGGIVTLVAGLSITFFAWQLPYSSEYGPGPGLLPLWIGMVLSASAILTIVNALRHYGHQEESFFQPKTRQVLFILVALIATFLLVPFLGLSVGLALFTGFTMRKTGHHSWILCGIMAVATAVAVWVIFGYMLDIPLPKGFIGL